MLTIGTDFFKWRSKLQLGDTFVAGLIMPRVDAIKPKRTTFRIRAIFPRVAEVECYRSEYRLICYINLVDLWHDRDLFVIQPTRREMIA